MCSVKMLYKCGVKNRLQKGGQGALQISCSFKITSLLHWHWCISSQDWPMLQQERANTRVQTSHASTSNIFKFHSKTVNADVQEWKRGEEWQLCRKEKLHTALLPVCKSMQMYTEGTLDIPKPGVHTKHTSIVSFKTHPLWSKGNNVLSTHSKR